MVKLLSGKRLHTTQDSIPQSLLAEARENEVISSVSAKGRSSDKHTYYIFFMPMCMPITI